MLPHSATNVNHETIATSRPSYMEAIDVENTEDNKDYVYFNVDNDIILEDEEEYDILNDETFGDLPVNKSPNLECNLEVGSSRSLWEDCDLHNDETFGEDIEYDWETEHEKFVNIVGNKSENSENEETQFSDISNNKLDYILSPDVMKRNGYRKIDTNNYFLSEDDDNENITKFKSSNRVSAVFNNSIVNGESENHEKSPYTDIYEGLGETNNFGSTEKLTNDNCSRISKYDKWFTKDNENKSSLSPTYEGAIYSQGYSLFSSGANLLQNAGINIPSVTNSSALCESIENLDKKIDDIKLESSFSSIPSVSDLEKQWINAASYQPIINSDCFRAYNSAFYVNSNSVTNNNTGNYVSIPESNNADTFEIKPNRDIDSNSAVLNLQKMAYPAVAQNLNYSVNGENTANLSFDRKMYPNDAYFKRNKLMQFNNSQFRAPHFAELNANTMNTFVNSNALKINATKAHPIMNSTVIVTSEALSPLVPDTSVSNSIISGLIRNKINVFPTPPPPPGLTLDPAKMCHVQSATVLQSRQQPLAAYLTLPPPQVMTGLVSVEQQKQLTKMQKEVSLSDVDEYAGMMTEREKYWLAGVQLLQINSMDPYKDDYYFTNYQARRKGNRNKNLNLNNQAWKNAHTKDYLPLQFENSLGKVQFGSVVAPRKVIDTDLIDNSPKQNKTDIVPEDLIVNTSGRKRKIIMLRIENMYGKIMALESLQVNSGKSKSDPATIKSEFESIVTGLKEEILNLKDDFKIIMSIKKGKRLILRFLSFCDNPDDVWYEIFEILDRIARGDHEHCVLLSYLPYFRAWLTSAELSTLIRVANHFKQNLSFYMRDKFSVSVIANMIEHAEIIYYSSEPEQQNVWMDFVINLAEKAHSSFDNVEKPVVSVRPQVLRSHVLKCKQLENGYMSYMLKVFSNNSRK